MLIHLCRRCEFQSMIFDEWFNHLWGKRHQDATKRSFMNWAAEEDEKSLVIYSPPEVAPPLPSDILTLFLTKGCLIVDFVYWAHQPRNFVVQFQHKDDLDKVLEIYRRQPSDLSVGGTPIQFRKKGELLSYEWAAIVAVSNVEAGPSRKPVVVELSDDSDSGGTLNGNVVEEVGVDEDASRTTGRGNGAAAATGAADNCEESSSEDEEDYSVELSLEMCSEFQKGFLAKSEQQESGKDDKKCVEKNLKKLGKLWLDVFVAFNNRLWPCCFAMSNKITKTNKNEIGFEAVFNCDALKSKRHEWLKNLPKSRREQRELAKSKLEKFVKIISDEDACEKRLEGLSKLKGFKGKKGLALLKFKCHMIVTYGENGIAKAIMKFEQIQGRKKIRKMNTVVEVLKLLFREFEMSQIVKWSPGQKIVMGVGAQAQSGGGKEVRKWTEIEIVQGE